MPDEDKQAGAADQKYTDRMRDIMDYWDSLPLPDDLFAPSPLLDRLRTRSGHPLPQSPFSAPPLPMPRGRMAIVNTSAPADGAWTYSTDWSSFSPFIQAQPARPEPPPSKPLLVELPTDRKIRFADG